MWYWFGMVFDGMGRMVWYGMGWYGMVWDAMGWFPYGFGKAGNGLGKRRTKKSVSVPKPVQPLTDFLVH